MSASTEVVLSADEILSESRFYSNLSFYSTLSKVTGVGAIACAIFSVAASIIVYYCIKKNR